VCQWRIEVGGLPPTRLVLLRRTGSFRITHQQQLPGYQDKYNPYILGHGEQ